MGGNSGGPAIAVVYAQTIGAVLGKRALPIGFVLLGAGGRYSAARTFTFSACAASFARRHSPPTTKTRIAPTRAANSMM